MRNNPLIKTQCSRRRFLAGLGTAVLLPAWPLHAAAKTDTLPRSLRWRIKKTGTDYTRWRHIIGHHSATPNGSAAIFDAYHRNQRHMENGLAYHFIIGNGTDSKDGQIEIGPRWTKQLRGGHVHSLAYNENSVGICLVGNFEKTRPTAKQIAAFTALVQFLRADVLLGRAPLLLHREVKGEQTLCPGRNFPAKHIHQLFD